jgi:predicted Zn finger-like uncharacterized protein
MIAACPRCAARYRIERERLEAGGVRLRCARCEAVFRVRPPPAEETRPSAEARPQPSPAAVPPPQRPAPAPARPAPASAPAPKPAAHRTPGDCVLVALREGELAKRTADLVEAHGYVVLRASDGVEAMLEIQRKLPRAVVLAADLPRMSGAQVCEVVKRNASLRETWLVSVGAPQASERECREAASPFGADAYLENPDLPDGILPLLARGGARPGEPARAKPAPPPAPEPERAAHAHLLAPKPQPGAAPPDTKRPRRNDGLDEERSRAERLARIVVSDIVLYNETRFAAAARAGTVLDAMAADLAEGRALFEARIDPRVNAERDYLKDELLRSARQRGMHQG